MNGACTCGDLPWDECPETCIFFKEKAGSEDTKRSKERFDNFIYDLKKRRRS